MSDENALKPGDAGASDLQPGQVLNVTVTGLPATSETISLVVPNSGGKTRRLAERFDGGPWAGTEAGAGPDATPDLSEPRELLSVTFTDGSRTLRGTINVPARRRFEDGDVLVYDKGQTVEIAPAVMDLLLRSLKPKSIGFSVSGRVRPPVEDPSALALREAMGLVRNRAAREPEDFALRDQPTEAFCPESEHTDVEVTDGTRKMTLRIRLGKYSHPVGGWWVLRAPDSGRKVLSASEYDCLLDELAGKKTLDHLGAQMAQHVRIVSGDTEV